MKKLVVLDRDDLKAIIRRRRRMGGDRYDEVWNGVYVMAPLANIEHQELSGSLTIAVYLALGGSELIRIFPGVNVSDQPEKWRTNFRCPDVAVYFLGTPPRNRETHWLGGPDFAVEILSRNDRSRKKFTFYVSVGVRELMCQIAAHGGWSYISCRTGVSTSRSEHRVWNRLRFWNPRSSLCGFAMTCRCRTAPARQWPARTVPGVGWREGRRLTMPLLDHFHPPLRVRRHWEGLHSAWANEISRRLNEVLPSRYFAEPHVRVGGIEVDIRTFDEEEGYASAEEGGVGVAVWAPPKPSRVVALNFEDLDLFEVRVMTDREGPQLVAAIELVSPANKDRPAHRQMFAIKCASYLQEGIGLVLVDVVTDRLANLHDELFGLLELPSVALGSQRLCTRAPIVPSWKTGRCDWNRGTNPCGWGRPCRRCPSGSPRIVPSHWNWSGPTRRLAVSDLADC